jgi:hypothetical protein
LAGVAFEQGIANKFELQKLCYAELRERFSLSSQMAIRCIAQVVEAYKRDKDKRPKYRKHSAIPFDQRMMSFKGPDQVSLLTLEGRVIVPFVMGKYQTERFGFARGQCDLVLRKDGKWFLLVTVDLPEGTKTPATDFLGVDLGIVNIAVDSDGDVHSGEAIEKIRRKHQTSRKTRQRKGTKGAKKQLKKLAGKEARFRKQENHRISKTIVAKAKGTGRGIALEDLTGIRDRTTVRKRQRNRQGGRSSSFDRSWSTRPSLRVCPSWRSTLATPAGRVPSAGIARKPTVRVKPSSCAIIADTPRTPITTQPATLRAWAAVRRPQNWSAMIRARTPGS